MRKQAAYSRRETLERAAAARNRGKTKKAIAEYRKVLEQEPDDHETHGRIAPLLLTAGKKTEAATSFSLAAEGQAADGFYDKAIALFRQAADAAPHGELAWLRVADMQLEKERPRDAVRALLEGRQRFRRRYDRPRAMVLLARVLDIDPEHLPAAVDLAVLLGRTGRRAEGLGLLDGFAERAADAASRRHVRWLQLRHFPSPRTFWRWLRRR